MNKLLSADGAQRFTQQVFFASPNAKAKALLPDALRNNEAIFPGPTIFGRLAYLTERAELLTVIDRLWTELKSQ